MNAPDNRFVLQKLPDIQSSPDSRRLAIQRVGVKSLRHPVLVRCADGSSQPSVASFDLYVALAPEVKGTHMSRFVEILDAHLDTVLDPASLKAIFAAMLKRLDADAGEITLRLPYFRRKVAPVSGVSSLLDYAVEFSIQGTADDCRLRQTVQVPVTSLCPCSREISDYGAHNQRSHLTLSVELAQDMDLDALIDVAENAASCQLWGLLKRPDEKYVTERAYDNPKFVEDLVRDVALTLRQDPRVRAFTVESENFESIHNHSAYARIEG